jgi:hypothetical protein
MNDELKPDLSGCEVMVDGEGVSLESNKPFSFTCCDCGLTHRCVIVSEDGKPVGFAIERDQRATAEKRIPDVGALMAMTEAEIDHELRSLGIDPAEAERRGKAAVEGALARVRAHLLETALQTFLFDFGQFDTDEERLAEFRRLRKAARPLLAARGVLGTLNEQPKEPR